MNGGGKAPASRHIRALVSGYLHGCQPGTRINACKLARRFSNKNRFVSHVRISLYLRERENLQHTDRNEWLVIA
jgi:hypothetical protein